MGATLRISRGVKRMNDLMADMSMTQRKTFANKALTQMIVYLQQEVTTSGDFIKHGRKGLPPLDDFLTSRHGGAGLIGSISPDYSKLPRLATLGSDLPYAGVHEFGRRGLAGYGSRPYLAPTFKKAARKGGRLNEIAVQVMQDLASKAGFK